MKAKGELFWQQLSMWEFSPNSCVEAYKRNGGHTFHYVLKVVDEITGERSYRTKVVIDFDNVPKEILEEMSEVYVKVDGVKTLGYSL